MIGVILWSDQATARAIIWCEDHSGLAYLSGEEADAQEFAFVVGDIVHLEVVMDGVQRLAKNVVRIDELRWSNARPDTVITNAQLHHLCAEPAANMVISLPATDGAPISTAPLVRKAVAG